MLSSPVFGRAGVGHHALLRSSAEAGAIAAPQPQADSQVPSPSPAAPARKCGCGYPGKGCQDVEWGTGWCPRKAGFSQPAGAAPSPSHVVWRVGTDLKLQKSKAIPTQKCAVDAGAPGGGAEVGICKAEQRSGRRDLGHGSAGGDPRVGHGVAR